ncbi:aldo/keto reductase [Parasphingorhabdus sp.]|uniref:aldo/keto reductase n=1 Tax=Parasphingorhabdus sp. TaxID=2709688 RepID=UPI003A9514E1
MSLLGHDLFPMGFGCGPLGVHGFGDVDIVECRKAATLAAEQGVNFFDTSDAYGRGVSEEQLAQALGPLRKNILISTKGGIRFDGQGKVFYDCSVPWLEQAMDASLRRLKTDFIDLYQLHYWDRKTPLEDIFSFFERCCEKGKIGGYGVSNLDLSGRSKSFFASFPNFQSHSEEFSMVHQNCAAQIDAMVNIVPSCLFLATGVLAQGLLSGKYNDRASFGDNDRRAKSHYTNFSDRKIALTRPLIALMQKENISPVSIAAAWVARTLPNGLPLVGIKSRTHLSDLMQAAALLNSDMDWTEIDREVRKFGKR